MTFVLAIPVALAAWAFWMSTPARAPIAERLKFCDLDQGCRTQKFPAMPH